MFCDCGKHVLRNDDKQRGKTGICRCTFKIETKMRNGNGVNMEEKLTDRLFIELLTNTQLSAKSKDRLSRLEDYFRLKQEAESKYISSTGFYDFFEKASLAEIEGMSIYSEPPNFWNEATLLEILIDTLKRFVDNEESLSEKVAVIYSKYQALKTHFPYLPEGDALKEFVASKGQREEVENARETGNICPKCLGHDIASKGKEWQCRSCHKRFRKH